MTRAANLGFPRIGARRELKRATEAFWAGEHDLAALERTAAELRAAHWATQRDAGIDVVPSNDFSFYDQVLDMTATLGAVPPRFGHAGGPVGLDTTFAMARGTAAAPAMEMTKWFDTNYHYIVPEFHRGQRFELASTKAVDEFREAAALGVHTRPVLIGPVSWLALGKSKEPGFEPLTLLDEVVAVYAELLERLAAAGADRVQIDEPMLALDLTPAQRDAYGRAYASLAAAAGPKVMLTTYFEGLRDNTELAAALPVAGLHVDLVRAPDQLEPVLAALRPETVLSLGVVDGRNVWRTDLEAALAPLETAVARLGAERIEVAPSCSLLHSPVDLDLETDLDPELKSWMAFAKQKLGEVATLARAAGEGREAVADQLAASRDAVASRRRSPRIHNAAVAERLAAVGPADARRAGPYAERRAAQRAHLDLPEFPTTTIGSFPQTKEVRQKRAAFRRGDLDRGAYERFLEAETERAVRLQEELGLDVLVHGEFERNDMVEYFGEQLDGFAFTRHGWVQSFGSRYVKPPVIFGDVARPEPMTVRWSAYAQSLTDQPVKGMLTGPVTILQWSFVRDDIPRRRHLPPDRARHPRRGDRPRGRGRAAHPDRRAGDARGPAAAPRRSRRLPRLGGRVLPPRVHGRGRRHADPHPHVLRRVQRHHAVDRGAGRRRHLDRDLALGDGAARRLRRVSIPERDRPRGVGHPLAARARQRRDAPAPGEGGPRPAARAAVGEPGLRAQDPRLARGRGRARPHGRSGEGAAGRRGGLTPPRRRPSTSVGAARAPGLGRRA